MRILPIFLFCFNIFKIFYALEDFDDNKSNIAKNGISAAELIYPPNSVSPEIVPPRSSNGNGEIGGQPIYSNSPCQTSCNSQGTQCPSYCNQAPQFCSSGCQQQQPQQPPRTVTVQVPVRVTKTVPEKITRTVQKQPRREKVEMETETIKQCPKNYKMIEDENDNQRCAADRASSTSCPVDYEFRNDKCIKTLSICANEHVKNMQSCALRVVCPQTYHHRGDECVPPTPQCAYGWNWNGRVCEPERLSCPSGYILGNNNQCIHEMQRCPPNYREFGNQCLMEEPACAYGFQLNGNTNICEKIVNKCPTGSYEQYGDCVNVSYGCPSGSKDVGNHCTYDETVQKIVHEIKYVPQTMTLPGSVTSNCNSYGNYGGYTNYPCASPCMSNCASPFMN
ncbi:prion-like-(Q/N-rich) domain-bearing protein 25 [Chironomus tepperi]|uniref:prion-like-(Q/N-rich) domain-bearing protein 25 n=1 Tax=Chironomus tepperi TaxID=113505 RepID=UPI00391F3C01